MMNAKKIMALTVCVLLMAVQVNAEETLTFTAIEGFIHSAISEKVLKEAYRRIGIKIIVKQYPAERAVRMADSGEADGDTNRLAGINKEYTNLIMISPPVGFDEGVVFTKDKVFPVNGWESLKPYKVGILRGNKFAERGTEGMRSFSANTIEQLFEMLDAGRTDLVVIVRLNGLITLKKLNLKGIRALEPPLGKYDFCHYLHKKNERLVPKIAASLQEMEKEGLMLKIREQTIADLLKK